MASRLDISRFREETSSVASSTHVTSPPSVVPEVVPEVQRPRVTREIVDRAVENVLSKTNYPPELKETFRKLLAADPSTGFSTHYHQGRSEAPVYQAFPRLEKRTVRVPLVLSPDETAELVKYAPEFELRFTDEEDQDHALAASMRKLDHQIVLASVPRGIPLKDVGGNPVYHIRAGTPNVHVCDPEADRKDPTRKTLRRMQAGKVKRTPGFSDASKELADRYLENDLSFCCKKMAQHCHHKAKVTTSCHVYDVKLEDWPRIMQAAGAVMHIGCLIFPTQAYAHKQGTLPSSKARYEVDVENNVIRMSFAESPAWWYSHAWLDFMRYGADQLINHDGERYSYKITERRGDTIFFQILRVSGSASLERQWYKMPGVPVVRVEGYEYAAGKRINSSAGRAPLRPKVYWFPAALWDDMLQQAEMDFERGVMSYDRLYNYYRTVSPRNTINGVLISGGQRVSHDQMVPLIVHVGMTAAMSVMLGQRTSWALTTEQMRSRLAAADGRLLRLLKTFWRTLGTAAVGLTMAPLRWLVDKLTASAEDRLLSSLVEWSYEPELVEVPFSSLVGDYYMKKNAEWRYEDSQTEEAFLSCYREAAPAEHLRAMKRAPAMASLIAELCADGLSEHELKELSEAASTVGSTTAVGAPGEEEPVKRKSMDPASDSTRRAAIQECIEESELERMKLEEGCITTYRMCTGADGEPVEHLLRKHAEDRYEPDFWFVNRGVLNKSVLGVEPADCRFSAVFSLCPDRHGSHFWTLQDVLSGEPGREKEYKQLVESDYTGWVMTMDRLQVYNGPEIRATLRKALDVAHDYEVVLNQGPPGCGKTRDLLQNIVHVDMGMCPVRESAYDTRERLVQQDPTFPKPRLRVRTVDSYLVNYSVGATAQLTCEVLHADEGFMTHAGKWYAAAGLLKAKRIMVYGDIKQIPHVPRVQAPAIYLRIRADVVNVKYDIYRCPADAVAAWAHVYEYRARTHSKVRKSLSVHESADGLAVPDGCVMLCMYQADKKEIRRRFAPLLKRKNIKVMTVHESEGKTFEHVWLFRFDTRERSDGMSLFDKEPYCLVAMSRHTKTFKYIRPRNLHDCVDVWYQQAQDPRAVAAAADVRTVGQSVQFL